MGCLVAGRRCPDGMTCSCSRNCIVGVAAALPGGDNSVFTPGVNNIHRIISGKQYFLTQHYMGYFYDDGMFC